jgi:hypothetical protein
VLPDAHAVLHAGSVALTLFVMLFCCASSESPDPPPQAASMPPIRLRANVLVTRDFMVPPLVPNDCYGCSALVFVTPAFAAFPRHTSGGSTKHTKWFFNVLPSSMVLPDGIVKWFAYFLSRTIPVRAFQIAKSTNRYPTQMENCVKYPRLAEIHRYAKC